MNSVLIAITVMLVLSLARIHVVIALLVGAVTAGLMANLGMAETLTAFNAGLGDGAKVAIAYAFLGAFAVAISRSGIPGALAQKLLKAVNRETSESNIRSVKWVIIGVLLTLGICSQNVLPIHIAFIPLVVPPLLAVMDKLQLDRRLIACVLTFALITPYMFLPVGFGAIFLNDILLANIASNGMNVEGLNVMTAMAIPALGMVVGLIIAVFFSYRGRRQYAAPKASSVSAEITEVSHKVWLVAGVAVAAAFGVQLWLDSMILGALVGFLTFTLSGVIRWNEADDVFTEGMKMMATIGIIMITAGGFAEVLKATGEIEPLVSSANQYLGGSKALGVFLMLAVGLLVTLGIGSSFSTVPVITAIFVPMCLALGLSPLATVSVIGTAAALGDAGSPASDSTLGPTAGLNADGQHNHIWDTVVPTFIHFNIPLLVFGWIAAMIL